MARIIAHSNVTPTIAIAMTKNIDATLANGSNDVLVNIPNMLMNAIGRETMKLNNATITPPNTAKVAAIELRIFGDWFPPNSVCAEPVEFVTCVLMDVDNPDNILLWLVSVEFTDAGRDAPLEVRKPERNIILPVINAPIIITTVTKFLNEPSAILILCTLFFNTIV
jgi:hypothetical protein